jgi:hypothetical protein
MKSSIKIFIIILIIVSVTTVNFLGIFIDKPKVVYAQLTTAEVFSAPSLISDFLIKFLNTQWAEFQKNYRDIIVAIVISKLQRDIIAQINGQSGSKGPQYIENWGKDLQQIASDVAVNQAVLYVRDLSSGAFDLCAPLGIQLQIRLGLLAQQSGYGGGGAEYYGLPTYCSFDDVKRNLESPEGTLNIFSNVGWSAFDAIVSPSVDINLAWAQMEDTIDAQTTNQQQIAQAKALSSQGFSNNQECTDKAVLEQADTLCNDDSNKKACVDTAVRDWCSSWSTITPGSVAAGAIMDSIGANFNYSSNVQSALAAVLNALASRVLSEGLARISSNDEEWAVSGSNQGMDPNDIPDSIKDQKEQTNRQLTADAKKGYEDVIYYTNTVLLPKVDADLEMVSISNSTCSSTLITIDQGGTSVLMTVGDLYNSLNDFKDGFTIVRDTASSGLDVINNLDYLDDTAVSQVSSDFQTFATLDVSSKILTDARISSVGGLGTLEIMLDSIYDALSSFSC